MKPTRRWNSALAAFLWWGANVHADAGQTLADFDNTAPELFAFKDEKGTVLNASTAYADGEKGKHLGIRYGIVPGGFGGAGLALKGFNASGYRYLGLDIRGDAGGESFDVGLRDAKGQERKRSIAAYTDVAKTWRRVLIPLGDFGGVTLSALDNISFGFAEKKKGRIYIDNIGFEGAAAGSDGALVNKVVVDGFDRTNPTQAYRVFTGDQSSLSLTSSRVLFDGDYSMEMQYQFSTNRPWGTWVSAQRTPAEPLNWTGIDEIKMWVKGDGSENYLRFRFSESDGEIWEYVDKTALASTRWTLVGMPIKAFKIVGQPPKGTPPDLAGVKAYEIALMSPTSSQTSGAQVTAGRIQVDLLYVTGERLSSGAIVPAAAPQPGAPAGAAIPSGRIPGLAAGNVDFSLQAYTEYFYTPEEKSAVNHLAKLTTTGKLGNYSARVEFGSTSQEFGQASTFVGSSVTATTNRFPGLEMPSFQVFITNLHPAVSLVTLGNLFIDYSPDLFAPVFGFKGIEVQGDVDRLNYEGFVIKHSLNSFTGGARGVYYLPNLKLSAYAVYWEQNGRQSNASTVSGGSLQPAANSAVLKLERLAQDMTYHLQADARTWNDRLRLVSLYGYNTYRQNATADYSDPFNPVFSQFVDPAYQAGGHLWRNRVELYGAGDFLGWRGLDLAYGYRDIGTGYKPHFRQVPVFYDDTDSDQWGHNVRAVQRRGGWTLSAEYDAMRRHSDAAYFRHKFLWGLGHYGYRGMDVSLTQDYRRETYKFTSDRSAFTTDKNEKVIGTELYVRAQLSSRVAGWVKPRQERIWHPATNGTFTSDSLQARLEYYVANNAKLFAEHKITRFSEAGLEPQGTPFDDNFTRISFEVVF